MEHLQRYAEEGITLSSSTALFYIPLERQTDTNTEAGIPLTTFLLLG